MQIDADQVLSVFRINVSNLMFIDPDRTTYIIDPTGPDYIIISSTVFINIVCVYSSRIRSPAKMVCWWLIITLFAIASGQRIQQPEGMLH